MVKTVLIVEDELAISHVLKAYLQKANFAVEQVLNGDEAISKFRSLQPALVLLDVMLPGRDGWSILKEIREQSSCPVIMLTALSDVNYRLTGLNDGADDYISKPFIGDEVVARVHAVLRRANHINENEINYLGHLVVDIKAHKVTLYGEDVELTPRDLSLLLFFVQHPNQTFTREQLIDQVWGIDYDGTDRAVDLAVKRIRKSLYKWPSSEGEIRTFRGLGYQFCVY